MSDDPQTSFSDAPPGATLKQMGDMIAPEAPTTVEDTGIDKEILCDAALRLAQTVPSFTTAKAAQVLCLPMPIVSELLDKLKNDKLIENLGQAGPIDYRFAITLAGRERARRLLEISGYVGPAPVSLDSYTANLEILLGNLPPVSPEAVNRALAQLVLPEEAMEISGLAGSSMRSFFIYGPPGNGKTSLGSMLHSALEGDLWIPHCVGIDSSIIRFFDPRFHEGSPFGLPTDQTHRVDRRWVRIRRPFVVVGGELTMRFLE